MWYRFSPVNYWKHHCRMHSKRFYNITRIDKYGTVIVNMEAIGRELTDEERDNINNGKTFGGDSLTYELNSNKVTLDQFSAEGNTIQISSTGTMTNSVSLRDLGYVLVTAVITIAMTLVSLFFAGFLCKAFKECQSPFEENVIKKMRGFAYSLIPMGNTEQHFKIYDRLSFKW